MTPYNLYYAPAEYAKLLSLVICCAVIIPLVTVGAAVLVAIIIRASDKVEDRARWVLRSSTWLQLKEQANEKERRQHSQLLLGYVNHEIRNPLQVILGLSGVARGRRQWQRRRHSPHASNQSSRWRSCVTWTAPRALCCSRR